MPYFGIGVYPSMNPSGVQLRRYAIHGYARHTDPEVLIDLLCCLHFCSLNHKQLMQLMQLMQLSFDAYDLSQRKYAAV